MRAPELSIAQILGWAKDRYKRSGKWPTRTSGRIPGSLGETWQKIDLALRKRHRGLSVQTSLAMLLHERCSVRHPLHLQRLTNKLILEWADDHRARHGKFPNANSGKVGAAPSETWCGVANALRVGVRGLTGGSSLAKLLRKRRGYRSHLDASRLSPDIILAWAERHRSIHGVWPTRASGQISRAPGETWARVANALVAGRRGLPGCSSLAQFLAEHRNVRNEKRLPKLRVKEIAGWAKAHFEETGRWPTHVSGPVRAADGETWGGINAALTHGHRGLPGRSSLYKVLHQYFRVPKYRNPKRS
jgi:hypothetical protein